MPPEPSRPQRSRTEAPATAPVDETAILRGGAAKPAAAKPEAGTAAAVAAAAAAAKSTKPATEDPAQPAAAKPAEPATAKPAEPATAKPAEPAPAKPAEPASGKPAAKPVVPDPKPIFLGHSNIASKVRGFGDLQAIDPPVVHAGDRFVAYFELGNWSVATEPEGLYAVRVSYKLTLKDFNQLPVWTEGPLTARDTSRTAPRDLFITRLVKLPASLPAGGYSLVIDATDDATGQMASTTVPFSIVAAAPEPTK